MHQQLLAVSIPEAARLLSLSPRTIAMLVSKRELASQKVGRRRIIPFTAIEEFMARDRVARNGSGLNDKHQER